MAFVNDQKPSLDELAHHGVKGMKWGVRRAKVDDSDHPDYSRRQRVRDTAIFGSSGVKRINKRMNAGKTYSQARNSEAKGAAAVTAALLGAVAVHHILTVHGENLMTAVQEQAVYERARSVNSNERGIGSKAHVDTLKTSKRTRSGVHKISAI